MVHADAEALDPVPEPGRRTRSSRKQVIIDAFAKQVAQRGYDGVSLRDIAEELRISKGTIIHHFGTKEQMLRQVHEVYMLRRMDEAARIIEALDSPLEQLLAIIYQNFIALRDDHEATVAFAREVMHFAQDDSMEPVRQLRQSYARLVTAIIERGMADGSLRIGDPRLLTLQVFGTFNWVWTWLRLDGEWTVDDIAATFADTLVRGMLSTGTPGGNLLSGTRAADVVRQVMARPEPN